MRWLVVGVSFLLVAGACGGGGSSPDSGVTIERERLETGRQCAMAHVACEAGRCVAEIDNRCDTPVTCQLHVESLCETDGGEVGPANTSTKHFTQLSRTRRSLEAHTACGQGRAVTTRVERVECI